MAAAACLNNHFVLNVILGQKIVLSHLFLLKIMFCVLKIEAVVDLKDRVL